MNAFVFAIGQPLFGSMWLAGLLVCAAIAVLLVAVAAVGRWLAATHPEPVLPPESTAPVAETSVDQETLAILACAVSAAFGARAQITSVSLTPTHPPSVEVLMQQWSLEGRRQIYTSHKVR